MKSGKYETPEKCQIYEKESTNSSSPKRDEMIGKKVTIIKPFPCHDNYCCCQMQMSSSLAVLFFTSSRKSIFVCCLLWSMFLLLVPSKEWKEIIFLPRRYVDPRSLESLFAFIPSCIFQRQALTINKKHTARHWWIQGGLGGFSPPKPRLYTLRETRKRVEGMFYCFPPHIFPESANAAR